MPSPPFSALLLAGGRSTRMGRDKTGLEWRGQPLWLAQVEKLRALRPARLMVACREEQRLHQDACLPASQVEWLFDPPGEDCGPIAAIARALERAATPLLVLPVDAPLVTPDWLRAHLLHRLGAGRSVFFRTDHGYEPLIAIYAPPLLPLLHAAVARRQFSLQRVVEEALTAGLAEALPLPPEHAAHFRPANTPEEWARQL